MVEVGRRDRQDRADHQGRNQVEGQRHHREAERRRRQVVRAERRAGRARQGDSFARRSVSAQANLQAAKAASGGAEAQLKKNSVEAEGPDVEFAKRNYDRAQQLFAQKLCRAVGLDDAKSAVDVAKNRQRAAQAQLGDQPGARSRKPRARSRRRRPPSDAQRRGSGQRHDPRADSRHGADARRRGRQPRVVDPQPGRQRHARDDARRHRARSSSAARWTRPTSATCGSASPRASASRRSRTGCSTGRVTQISPIGVEKDNVTTFEVKVSIDNPGKELKANMTANAEIVLEEHPNSLHRPRGARSPTTPSATPRSMSSIPARKSGRAQGRRSRSASATARRRRSSRASSRATRLCCPVRSAGR